MGAVELLRPRYRIIDGRSEILAAAAAQTQPASVLGATRSKEQEAQVEEPRWQRAMNLPCEVAVDLPLPKFRVSDFLALRPGSVVSTSWRLALDVPLRVNGVLIGWGELEGASNRLAVRLMELA
ncbi:MAG TPA: FliM/FliN family flagellar motor C-terminal domain-containing protein [Candidatus Acidoferrales bacterium]|nr:FliM/FliN family flagellar motor C-terminal domain-containing protein [Candidatus Acidoferrales bacterium]